MVDEPLHVRPLRITTDAARAIAGSKYICPFCSAESTLPYSEYDIGWVNTPLLKSSPQLICLGCCEDIYSTCAAVDLLQHPYRHIVEKAARVAGRELNDFRDVCLRHQLDELRKQLASGLRISNFAVRESHLVELLRKPLR